MLGQEGGDGAVLGTFNIGPLHIDLGLPKFLAATFLRLALLSEQTPVCPLSRSVLD